jgi:hypothetical protein
MTNLIRHRARSTACRLILKPRPSHPTVPVGRCIDPRSYRPLMLGASSENRAWAIIFAETPKARRALLFPETGYNRPISQGIWTRKQIHRPRPARSFPSCRLIPSVTAAKTCPTVGPGPDLVSSAIVGRSDATRRSPACIVSGRTSNACIRPLDRGFGVQSGR